MVHIKYMEWVKMSSKNHKFKGLGVGILMFLTIFLALILALNTSIVMGWVDDDFDTRFYINCTNALNVPVVINGSQGFLLPGTDPTRQYVWVKCPADDIYLYFINGTNNYSVATDTDLIAYDVETGNSSSYLPTTVWSGYMVVNHMKQFNSTHLLDSSPLNNSLRQGLRFTASSNTTDYIGGFGIGIMQKNQRVGNSPTASYEYLESVKQLPFSQTYRSFTWQGYAQSIIDANGYGVFLAMENATIPQFRMWYYHTTTYFRFSSVNVGDVNTNVSESTKAHLVYGVYNGTHFRIYANISNVMSDVGVLAEPGNFMGTGAYLCVGGTCNNGYYNWNGTMDEIRIYNGTLSTTQMQAEYNNFMALPGYGILGALEQNAIPSVTWVSIAPINLTSFNFINKQVNITFNFAYLNASPISLYRKTNNSVSDVWYHVNGTSYAGYITSTCVNTSSSTAVCQLDDNEILPGSYNLDPELFEDNVHVAVTNLTGVNQWVKLGLQNISAYNYGWFEYMINASGAGNYSVVFCNSSYVSGDPLSNANCAQFGTMVGNIPYNHSHNGNSSHYVLPFAVSASGTINGVKVTTTGYFMLKGGTSTVNVWGLNTASNNPLYQISINNGNTWSNIGAVSVDYHLHQLRAVGGISDTTFYYYGLGYFEGGSTTSSIKNDLLELDLLPPTTPMLYPVQSIILRNTTVAVNWTVSNDPNDGAIVYNLTQYNENGTYAGYTLETNLTTVTINFTMPVGNYTFRLYAKNVYGLLSGLSYSNSYKVCEIGYICNSYHVCETNNVSRCLSVVDSGCGYLYPGNITDFDLPCNYTAPVGGVTFDTFDLSNQSNIILFGILIFFWLGLLVVSLAFRNFAILSFMWLVGLLLGLLSLAFSFILAMAFILLSTLVFMTSKKFK